jgi:hypothetical protein
MEPRSAGQAPPKQNENETKKELTSQTGREIRGNDGKRKKKDEDQEKGEGEGETWLEFLQGGTDLESSK